MLQYTTSIMCDNFAFSFSVLLLFIPACHNNYDCILCGVPMKLLKVFIICIRVYVAIQLITKSASQLPEIINQENCQHDYERYV